MYYHPLRRWRPTGLQITNIDELKEGMSVQARRYDGKKIFDGYVKIKFGKGVYEHDIYWIFNREGSKNFYIGAKNAPHGNDFKYYKIYKLNRFQRRTSMSNKLMAMVRLNKNQRKLAKVGVYDENGNLTEDGQEVLLNLVAKEYESKLIELAKDFKDSKKSKKCDDEDDD